MPDEERPPLSARGREAVVAARRILEESGVEGLSMRTLAARLGIKAPSLYSHFRDKKDIENALIAEGLREQAEAETAAIARAAPGEEITMLWQAYRRWGLANPALHRLIASRSLDRDDAAVAAAEIPGIQNVLATTCGDRAAGLAFWAFAFGMLELELSARFPPGQDLEAVWERGLAAIAATVDGA
jgi:AcrR family transcriptional regulator